MTDAVITLFLHQQDDKYRPKASYKELADFLQAHMSKEDYLRAEELLSAVTTDFGADYYRQGWTDAVMLRKELG